MFFNAIWRFGREAIQQAQLAADAASRTVTRTEQATVQPTADPFRPDIQFERAAQVALHRIAEIVGAVTQDAQTLVTPPARVPSASNVDDEGARLARRYAPVFYLHPRERYEMADPTEFVENSELRQHRSFRPDDTLQGRGEVTPEELRAMPDEDDTLALDHPNDDVSRGGDASTAPILYQYDAAERELTYWTFFNYNNKDYVGPLTQEHEGDWERVTVELNEDLRPDAVLYSNHDSPPRLVDWQRAPLEDGQPVVYVALGSHANSPWTGDQHVEVDGPDVPLSAGGGRVVGMDIAPDTDDEFAAGGVRVDASRRLEDVTEQAWYGTGVDWGSRGAQDFSSGPEGPSPGKGGLER
ncbi:MAG TPA: Vps62-related protein [Pyrinomonadaceae bacterium]|nr:Vps62-related protein [Pyrinomonadaceae bacterium]